MQFMILMIPAGYRNNDEIKQVGTQTQKTFRRWDDSMKNYRSR